MKIKTILTISIISALFGCSSPAVLKDSHKGLNYYCFDNETGKTLEFLSDSIRNAKMYNGKITTMEVTLSTGESIVLLKSDIDKMDCYLKRVDKEKHKRPMLYARRS